MSRIINGIGPLERIHSPSRSRLSLRSNFIWTFLGTVIYNLSQWIILVLLAKMYVAEVVGQFTFALSVTAPIVMLANLQLRAIQATDSRDEYAFGHYLSLRLLTTGGAFFVIMAVGVFVADSIALAIVILVVGVAKLVDSGSDLFYGLMQKQERMDRIAWSQITRGTFGVICFATGLILTDKLVFGVIGMIIAWLLVLFLYDMRAGRKILHQSASGGSRDKGFVAIRPNWDMAMLSHLVRISLPFGLAVFIGSFLSNVPKYLLAHFHGVALLGYFGAIAFVATGVTMGAGTLSIAARPRLAQYYVLAREKYYYLLRRLLILGVLLGVASILGALLIGKSMLTVVYSADYSRYHLVLVWLMLFFTLSLLRMFMHAALQAARIFNIQVFIALANLGVTVIAGWLLIAHYGINGAAITLNVFALFDLVMISIVFLRLVVFAERKNGRG